MQNSSFDFLHNNFLRIITSLVFVFTVILFAYFYFNKIETDNTNYSEDTNIQDNFVLPPQEEEKYLHFKEGNTVTVINYFSLDCPFCRKLFFTEKEFVQKYGDKANFAFRDKPLSSYSLSYEKALIKECIYLNVAGEVGEEKRNKDRKYFEFSEEVFKNYIQSSDNDWVKEIAKKYISNDQLQSCLIDESLKQKILGFRAKADASQIFWTPTIVVFKNGVEVERIEKVWADIYKKVLDKFF